MPSAKPQTSVSPLNTRSHMANVGSVARLGFCGSRWVGTAVPKTKSVKWRIARMVVLRGRIIPVLDRRGDGEGSAPG